MGALRISRRGFVSLDVENVRQKKFKSQNSVLRVVPKMQNFIILVK